MNEWVYLILGVFFFLFLFKKMWKMLVLTVVAITVSEIFFDRAGCDEILEQYGEYTQAVFAEYRQCLEDALD